MKKVSKLTALMLAFVLAVGAAMPAFAAPSKDTGDVTVENVIVPDDAFVPGKLTPKPEASFTGTVNVSPITPNQTQKDKIKVDALNASKGSVQSGNVLTGVTVHKGFQMTVTGTIPAEGIKVDLGGLALPSGRDYFIMEKDAMGNWHKVGVIADPTNPSIVVKANGEMMIVSYTQSAPTPGVDPSKPVAPQTGMGFPVAAAVAVMSMAAAAFCLKKSRA